MKAKGENVNKKNGKNQNHNEGENKTPEQEEISKLMEELAKMESDEKAKETSNEPKVEKSDLEQAQEKIQELTNDIKRLQADFDNYRKRVDKNSDDTRKYQSSDIITKLLPIIDTFEIAIKNSNDLEKYKEGTELIYAELMNVLKNEGVQKIDAKGKTLDPYLHDAMMAVEVKNTKPDTIVEVLQEGYKLKDRVIRHSKVKISK